jgi:hypothetical protein
MDDMKALRCRDCRRVVGYVESGTMQSKTTAFICIDCRPLEDEPLTQAEKVQVDDLMKIFGMG